MNTELTYQYRDGSNYKRCRTVILAGEMQLEDVKPYLDDGKFFIASQVGLKDIQSSFGDNGYFFPTEDDHVYSELLEESFSFTNKEPNTNLTAEELKENFQKTEGKWDEELASQRLGITFN